MATSPNLLNPVLITIAKVNESKTKYDHIRRTPITYVAREESFQINAQVVWDESLSAKSLPVAQDSGMDDRQFGHAMLRVLDLDALGKTIDRGDKITYIDGIETNLYVLNVMFGSHYGGRPTLAKVVFSNRRSHGSSGS